MIPETITLEFIFTGFVLGIAGCILLLALFALLARLTAASEDPPARQSGQTPPRDPPPDRVDIRAVLRKYSDD
jgi:hypothetical protein